MKKRFLRTLYGEIAVRESGGDSDPVLFVHDVCLGSESIWRQIAGEPETGFRMITFDFPGHGDSPRAAAPEGTYSIPAFAALLGELAMRLGLREPLLVGHGMGGHVALQAVAAGLNPRAVALIGTPPLSGPWDLPEAFLPEGLGGRMLHADLPGDQRAWCAQVLMPPRVPSPPFYARSIAATDPAARELLGASIRGDPVADEAELLRGAGFPVAVLIGEHDRIVNAGFLRALRLPTLWRGGIQTIRGAGHCPQYESPLAFNALLLDFLRDATARASLPFPAAAARRGVAAAV